MSMLLVFRSHSGNHLKQYYRGTEYIFKLVALKLVLKREEISGGNMS